MSDGLAKRLQILFQWVLNKDGRFKKVPNWQKVFLRIKKN